MIKNGASDKRSPVSFRLQRVKDGIFLLILQRIARNSFVWSAMKTEVGRVGDMRQTAQSDVYSKKQQNKYTYRHEFEYHCIGKTGARYTQRR